MKILCIHCGGEFSILADQLGGKGNCPHCRAEITLPKAHQDAPTAAAPRRSLFQLLDGSISGLGSMIIHMGLLLAVALFQPKTRGSGEGLTNEVLIGILPSEQLTDQQEEQVSADDVKQDRSAERAEEMVEVEPVTSAAETSAASSELSAAATPSPSGGESGGFDLGTVRLGGGSMAGGGGSWDGMIRQLQRNGLDIVICFDSTGSMSGEIDQVKSQISKIGMTLVKLVPKARISICTYRDQGDEFVAKGLPLTGNIQDVQSYLNKITAGGGGDHPEAVDEGIRWSVSKNDFRSSARKVILIFGDAPPHPENMKRCTELAAGFKGQQKGIVSTVTCHHNTPMPEFYEIAAAGGGEAFTTENQREIMQQLMVLVFGSKHKEKVLEAFDLLEK